MPHFKEFLDPNFLSNVDFLNDKMQYERKIVTITELKKEQVHDGKSKRNEPETVASLHFAECKPLILSNRNFKTILQMTKKVNVDDWKGVKLELYILENQKAFGQMWDVVRVSTNKVNPGAPADYSKQSEQLRACTTFEALKATFLGMTKQEQIAMAKVTEEMKTKLTPKQNESPNL
jgi:hypothetical protein